MNLSLFSTKWCNRKYVVVFFSFLSPLHKYLSFFYHCLSSTVDINDHSNSTTGNLVESGSQLEWSELFFFPIIRIEMSS